MEILLSTTGIVGAPNPLVIPEFGNRSIPVPTSNLVLSNEYSLEEIRTSTTLKSFLTSSYITMTDEFGRAINETNIENIDDNQGLNNVLNIEGLQGISTVTTSNTSSDFLLMYSLGTDTHSRISVINLLEYSPNFANTNLTIDANRTHDIDSKIFEIISDAGYTKPWLYLDSTSSGTDQGSWLGWNDRYFYANSGNITIASGSSNTIN
jgi:hypothetical protein